MVAFHKQGIYTHVLVILEFITFGNKNQTFLCKESG